MSLRVVADVLDYGPEGVKERAKTFVLVILASYSNDDGGSCYPSIKRIASMARMSERSVMRAIQSLEKAGWLTVEHDAVQTKNKHGKPDGKKGNLYVVNVERLHERKLAALQASKPTHVTKSHVTKSQVTKSHVTNCPDSRDTVSVGNIRKEPVIEPVRKPTPTPSVPEGVRFETQLVMRECHFTSTRLAPVIAAALEGHRRQSACDAAESARLMVANHRQFVSMGPYLRYRWGTKRWVEDGHWINWEAWPIDYERLERDKHVRIGTP